MHALLLVAFACAPSESPPAQPEPPAPPAEAKLAHDRHTEWRGTASGLGADVPAVLRVTPFEVNPPHFFAADHPLAGRVTPTSQVDIWLDLESVDPVGLTHATHWTGQLGVQTTSAGVQLRLVAAPTDGPCGVGEVPTTAQATLFDVRRKANELVVEVVEPGACTGPTSLRATR